MKYGFQGSLLGFRQTHCLEPKRPKQGWGLSQAGGLGVSLVYLDGAQHPVLQTRPGVWKHPHHPFSENLGQGAKVLVLACEGDPRWVRR